MSLMEKDLVLTTDKAIEYLKISKPTFQIYPRWKNEGHQSRKGLEDSIVRIVPILNGEVIDR